MVVSNFIQRTFQLKILDSYLTGFTIDVDNRHYLCTAKHWLPSTNMENSIDIDTIWIEIFHEDKWKSLKTRLVGFGSEEMDICVLTPEHRLSPFHPLTPTSADLCLGQEVYFLGFPYIRPSEKINNLFPIPLVKRAIVSALPSKRDKTLYLDGHNNKGFSGGPVVFQKNSNSKNEFCVAVVVKGDTREKIPVVGGAGEVYLNAGIVVSHDISHAIDAINKNPIGLKIG